MSGLSPKWVMLICFFETAAVDMAALYVFTDGEQYQTEETSIGSAIVLER